jgi:hypothetical protein
MSTLPWVSAETISRWTLQPGGKPGAAEEGNGAKGMGPETKTGAEGNLDARLL